MNFIVHNCFKMDFVRRAFLFSFVLLIFLIADGACSDVVKDSKKNALQKVESDQTTATTLYMENMYMKVPSTVTQKIKKLRKRKRRKRIRSKLSSVTVTPTYNQTTVYSVTPHEEKIKRRQGKLKKRRRGSTGLARANKGQNRSNNSPLETRNLVLPVTPRGNFLPTSTFTPRQEKMTRCSINNGGCAHTCKSSGTTKCGCLKGFTLARDSHNCFDINECIFNNGNCEVNCTNTVGSYRCQCPQGLRLNRDQKSCEDINECLLRNGHGPCQDTCINTHGGYKCRCDRLLGTTLDNDGHSCIDLDECAQDNGGCSHICINTYGRFFCSCPEGMELSSNLKSCQDINECESEDMKIKCPNGCINTQGSYRCLSISDLQNDESYQYVVCPPLFPPKNGYFKCSRKHALKTHTKLGRRQIKNSLGTKCLLVCPEGFKRRGRGFRLNCGYGGHWLGKMDAECVDLEGSLGDQLRH